LILCHTQLMLLDYSLSAGCQDLKPRCTHIPFLQ
jgi:hypothetical protein